MVVDTQNRLITINDNKKTTTISQRIRLPVCGGLDSNTNINSSLIKIGNIVGISNARPTKYPTQIVQIFSMTKVRGMDGRKYIDLFGLVNRNHFNRIPALLISDVSSWI